MKGYIASIFLSPTSPPSGYSPSVKHLSQCHFKQFFIVEELINSLSAYSRHLNQEKCYGLLTRDVLVTREYSAKILLKTHLQNRCLHTDEQVFPNNIRKSLKQSSNCQAHYVLHQCDGKVTFWASMCFIDMMLSLPSAVFPTGRSFFSSSLYSVSKQKLFVFFPHISGPELYFCVMIFSDFFLVSSSLFSLFSSGTF